MFYNVSYRLTQHYWSNCLGESIYNFNIMLGSSMCKECKREIYGYDRSTARHKSCTYLAGIPCSFSSWTRWALRSWLVLWIIARKQTLCEYLSVLNALTRSKRAVSISVAFKADCVLLIIHYIDQTKQSMQKYKTKHVVCGALYYWWSVQLIPLSLIGLLQCNVI